jgi:DNA-binding transcriptional regulator YiaG
MYPSSATVRPMATSATTTRRAALVDLLELMRERVPLSDQDVAKATGVDTPTVNSWLGRTTVPEGEQAVRLSELVAAVERLEVSMKPGAIADWMRREVPALDGRTPLQTLAAGGYARLAGFAEDLIDPPFS